jgi:hypothetical protein
VRWENGNDWLVDKNFDGSGCILFKDAIAAFTLRGLQNTAHSKYNIYD